MNNLSRAAETIENGWCIGDLHQSDGDKYCAVGALAKEVMGSGFFDVVHRDVRPVYKAIKESPEAQTLAKVIFENTDAEEGSVLFDEYQDENYPAVIYEYNDFYAEDKQDVIDMFRKAAVEMGEL